MAFTTFVSGTAADADEVTANFYHIAQGDRLPRGGTSLDPTDSVYNIGATATTWANLYADTVNCTSIEITGNITSDLMPYVIQEYEINSVNTQSSNIFFTGLHGDIDGEYQINIFAVALTTYTSVRIYFNNDTSYSYYMQNVTMTTIFDANSYSCSSMVINLQAKSGKTRMALIKYAYTQTNTASWKMFCGSWVNTTDELTSITINNGYGNFITGTSIQIWVLPS